MEEQSIVNAIMSTRSQIDFLWQFFVTVQLALFALLFVYDDAADSMNSVARVLAICGVGVFDWINGNALRGAYGLLDALHQQYRLDHARSTERFAREFIDRFVNASFSGREEMLLMTHTTAFIVVAMAFVWPRFIQHHRAK